MSDLLDDMKNTWNIAKASKPERASITELIDLSKEKMRGAVRMHLGNIAILAITLIAISSFFFYLAPLQEVLSHVGIALMTGGLLVRIAIECYSIYLSSKMDFSETAVEANGQALGFHAYRKRIHGPVTIGILIAYTAGFYILLPEFADYFTSIQVLLMGVSYLLGAAIFGFSIRRAIKNEMKILNEMIALQNDLIGY